MELFKHTFLYKCYREFKLLFVIVVIWAVGTVWFALHSREEFPFLLFGMYSLKEETRQEYETYSLIVDGKELLYADYRDARREMLQSTISNVNANTPLTNEPFLHWIKQTTGNKPFQIIKRRYSYNDRGQPVNTYTQIIYPYDIL